MAYQALPAARTGGPKLRPAPAGSVSASLKLVLAALVWLCAAIKLAEAQPVPAEVRMSTADGYARLVFHFRREVAADVKLANNILVITFASPVNVNIERLSIDAPDYVRVARRDPDGMAVRIALVRKVRSNVMPAGERLFVDLLPETWTGLPPGLPQEIVEDLTRRVREAEKRARLQQQLANWKRVPPIRVRAATQPTFTRYTIPLPNLVAIAADRGQHELTLMFDAPLRFDLADVIATLPPYVASIEPKLDEDTATVRFAFEGKVDVRNFREDNNYVVDVSAAPLAASSGESLNQTIDELIQNQPATLPAAADLATAPHTVPASAPPDSTPPASGSQSGEPPSHAPPKPAQQQAVAAATRPSPPASDRNATAIETVPAAPSPSADSPPSNPAHADPPRDPAIATPAAQTAGDAHAVKAEIKPYENGVQLVFPFAAPTPAAIFRRGDVMWLVFDSDAQIDVDVLRVQPQGPIRGASVVQEDGRTIRLKLDRPRLGSLAAYGNGWVVTIADQVVDPVAPVQLTRSMAGPARASIIIPFDGARRVHRITDPDAGDTLLVVSALGPVRGILKQQDFVELRALPSTHGIVIQPLAEDVAVQVAPDRVVIGRPHGLALSAHVSDVGRKDGEAQAFLDIGRWMRDREGSFYSRQSQLFNAAADAPPDRRSAAHVNIARFYLAREMFLEAKAALDLALSAEHAKDEDAGMYALRGVAKLMSGRPKEALQDLAHPSVGNQHDAPLWRAIAYAKDGRWAEAREGLHNSQMSIGMLPIELQRRVLLISAYTALEVGDLDGASSQLNDFDTIGVAPNEQAELTMLRGLIAEKLGRTGDAIKAYRAAADAKNDRQTTMQARLRLAVLRMSTDDLKRPDAITELETISVIWRGDRTEMEALKLLARLYTEEGRVRDAFGAMRVALTMNSRSDLVRSIQDEAAATFESLFLSGKGEALSAIDALSLFYDFRDLTPIGRRGDEMIRRLADRLVSIDLLDQAAELLQHQVDKRLQGAARAQVAIRLAMIYLFNNKPDRALAALRGSHVSGLADTLRNRRLMLEARALSELSRPDVALEIITNIAGPEAERLRADILWKARRWRPAAEQIERLLGNRWRDWQPLDALERNDVLRAAIGYTLGEDAIGANRLRTRYGAKMTDGPDRRAFDVVTSPIGPRTAEFGAIASSVTSIDTLEGFLRDMRKGISNPAAMPTSAATPVN